jgi:hypothetical protein
MNPTVDTPRVPCSAKDGGGDSITPYFTIKYDIITKNSPIDRRKSLSEVDPQILTQSRL